MFIAISQIHHRQRQDRRGKRSVQESSAPGRRRARIIRMEVISPRELPAEIWLLTYWETEEAFSKWHHSHLYHESHKGIPKGLKLLPKSARLRFFESICS